MNNQKTYQNVSLPERQHGKSLASKENVRLHDLEPRDVFTQKCQTCGVIKDINWYTILRRNPTRYRRRCKPCIAAAAKQKRAEAKANAVAEAKILDDMLDTSPG